MDRGAAAKIGGMDRQTLRDWVHRFNAEGPAGLLDHWTSGPTSSPPSARAAGLPSASVRPYDRWRHCLLSSAFAAAGLVLTS